MPPNKMSYFSAKIMNRDTFRIDAMTLSGVGTFDYDQFPPFPIFDRKNKEIL